MKGVGRATVNRSFKIKLMEIWEKRGTWPSLACLNRDILPAS